MVPPAPRCPSVGPVMADERTERVVALLRTPDGQDVDVARLAEVCAEVTGASGAGLMVMSGDMSLGAIATSDHVSAVIEDLQFALGEGPCIDSYHEGRPILVPDLSDPAVGRWISFAPAAIEAGAAAIFAFPLQVGNARLGALNLYADRPRSLTVEQHADAIVVAGLAAQMLLMVQAKAPPGVLAHELSDGANLQYVVHQASGMVAAQLEVSVTQALIRLRGHAFGEGRPLKDVARDVVERRLRFTRSGETDAAGGAPP